MSKPQKEMTEQEAAENYTWDNFQAEAERLCVAARRYVRIFEKYELDLAPDGGKPLVEIMGVSFMLSEAGRRFWLALESYDEVTASDDLDDAA